MRPFALILCVLFLAGCPPKAQKGASPDPRAACCAECKEGAATDPQGRDLSLIDCAEYAKTDACRAHFATHPTFVQDCR